MKLYPAILTDSIEEVEQQLLLVKSLIDVGTVQIDVIDGIFADNLTITPIDLITLDFGELKIDFQLMVEEPLDYLNEIIQYKKHLPVRAVLGQIERMSSQKEFIELTKENEMLAGLSIDIFTPISEVQESLFSRLDVIQLMSIEAGFQGQIFNDRVVEKIVELNGIRKAENVNFEIIIDGGIKEVHLDKLKKLNVDGVAVGSWLWNNDKPEFVVEAVNR